MKEALIIFVRNPELGKVKTRLAAVVGDQRALEIYKHLLNHTKEVALACDCDRYVFVTGNVSQEDWVGFTMEQQSSGDLGDKMSNAFDFLFEKKYEKVIIIGSDCLELSGDHLIHAFNQLAYNDTVIGPANDGGYYLLGMKKHHKAIFANKNWGTESVFSETFEAIEQLGLRMHKLEYLNDIDEEKDLPDYLRSKA